MSSCRLYAVLLWLLLANGLAQTLKVAPQGQLGQPLEIAATDLPPGSYTLEIEAPQGSQKRDLEALEGSFSLFLTPEQAGLYRLRLPVGERTLETSFAVAALVTPVLESQGLRLGQLLLPLEGAWLGPEVVGSRAFLARDLLVLEIDLEQAAVVAHHYPPVEVREIRADPQPSLVLADGRVLGLSELGRWPFEGAWEKLETIRGYQNFLVQNRAEALDRSPTTDLPYWVYWVRDPTQLSPEDLADFGIDLLRRGHRPELPWGNGVVRYLGAWARQMVAARQSGVEASLIWSEVLMLYTPVFPGSRVLLRDQANWLEAQSRPDLALRYRLALDTMQGWSYPWQAQSSQRWALVALLVYLALLIYLWVAYLPPYMSALRQTGGWWASFRRQPWQTPLTLASLGERLLLFLVLLGLLGLLLVAALDRETNRTLTQDAYSRATLRSHSAQVALGNLANTPDSRALVAYSLLAEDPSQSQRLFGEAPDWPMVLYWRNTPADLARAYSLSPNYPAVRAALGLGGDLWQTSYQQAGLAREATPTAQTLWLGVHQSLLSNLGRDPWGTWRQLALWTAAWQPWVVAGLLGLAILWQGIGLFLPRPRMALQYRVYKWWVQLFFPGSPWYDRGWGLLLLLAVGLGAWASGLEVSVNLYLAAAAMAVHLWSWWAVRPPPAATKR
jgi:hypothetical protein